MDLPPKAVRHQVRALAGMPPSRPGKADAAELAPIPGNVHPLRAGGQSQPDPSSLPVLNAFQAFIEKERRQARRRMLALTFGLVAVFLVLATSAAFVGLHLFGRLAERVSLLQSQVASLRSESAALRAESKRESERLSGEGNGLRNELARLQDAATAGEPPRLQLAAYSNELAQLRERVDGIASSNSTLREELLRLRADAAARASNAVVHARASARDAEPAPAPAPGPAAAATLTIPIIPSGRNETVPWQVLIPE